MKDANLAKIRAAERASHIKMYQEMPLYQSEGWLKKAIKTILELLPLFDNRQNLKILDLGCGVGRNCLPFALKYTCDIDCVDILDLAIEKLNLNAQHLNVQDKIHGVAAAIEDYEIVKNEYDLIIAVSALEHVCSKEVFFRKIDEIKNGIRAKGVVCLVINTGVQERDMTTGENLPAQFEVNVSKEELQTYLKDCFDGWKIMKETVSFQKYVIPREQRFAALTSEVVTLTACKEEKVSVKHRTADVKRLGK